MNERAGNIRNVSISKAIPNFEDAYLRALYRSDDTDDFVSGVSLREIFNFILTKTRKKIARKA